MSNFKKVIIVGRANVGKSTLFNRFSTDVKSITSDFAGVTRDFIRDIVSWNGATFELIDSGGLILKKTQDEIALKVRDIGLNLINQADLILFVCDGTTGVLPEDREISKILHQSGKKVIVLVNKIDTKLAQEQQYEFENLGFNQVVPVSAQHAINTGELLNIIVDNIGSTTNKDDEEAKFKIVLLGKPNVGKSSLLNCLLQEERSIVADFPGTTREAV
ncbi:MAG: GTPase, partial [Bacteroidota bacterium]